ncbi:transcription factor bHLH123-like isoform X2 [Lotus japonicus]|uniref:transcription factor bHLH123-like isoform X2 n=1 Tax=Lotus japonicus TaxID=34305 RepID=UPI0025866D4D|nr:transcription factor bHLH123-like isoform X2 [Lotus japonicus]
MADEEFQASGNWWDKARNLRFSSGASQSSSSSITNMGNFPWQSQDIEEVKQDSSTSIDPKLHMMGLGLSSQPMDWNQASLLRGEKGTENCSFRSMLQENLNSSSSEQQILFTPEESSSNDEYNKQVVNRGSFSLDQNQGLLSTFQIDSSSALYGNPSSMLQGLLGPENNNNMGFPHYGSNSHEVPQFLRASPPNPQPPLMSNQLHFTNNAPFWNASEAAAPIKDVRSSFFPSMQPSFSTPNFHVQSKNISEVLRDSGVVRKKSGSEPPPKRTRNETPSPMPAFKVRKEKMGDRITALQQLVSPFGKTDTASVLSEALEYIKFLHEQVLSTPYMKSGAPVQIQQSSGKSKVGEGPKQDLRSRGLCLVPVSSTFPMTHETTVDFWTPTFGGGTSR